MLYKALELAGFLSGQRNEVAEFYSGLIYTTFDLNVRHELNECMENDHKLTVEWDKAIKNLAQDNQESWEKHFKLAMKLSPHDMEKCGEIGKLAVVGGQLEHWWSTFWSQEGAQDIVEENFMKRPLKNKIHVGATYFDWTHGYAWDAGKQFGHFWKALLGKPEWQTDFTRPAKVDHKKKPDWKKDKQTLADFQGMSMHYMFDKDLTKNIHDCVVTDWVEYKVLGAAIDALSPYDDFTWNKYLQATTTMDSFNWKPCMKDKEVAALIKDWTTYATKFWSQEDVKTIVEKNVKKNYKDIVKAVTMLQKHWKAGEMKQAGFYWGQYWSLIMDGKPTASPIPELVEKPVEEEVESEESETDEDVEESEEEETFDQEMSHKQLPLEYDDDMLSAILQ